MWLCSENLELSGDPCWGVRFNYASGKGEASRISGWSRVGEASTVAADSDPGVLTLV